MRTPLLPCLLSLVLLSSTSFAQSSVWKVTRGDQLLYLAGTIHVLRPADFPLPAEFEQAFAASSRIVFETELARLQSSEMQQVVARHGIYQDGRTLEDVLTPEAWSKVQAYARSAGLPLPQLSPLKPWLFTITLLSLELQKQGVIPGGVDLYYYQKATAAGKPVGELESFEQQVQFMINLGAGHESAMVLNTIEDIEEIPEQLSEMISAWRSGDVVRIDSMILEDLRTEFPAVFRDLFVTRNEAWLPRIESLLKTPEIEMVLVGAGHVAGDEGLIARLRQRGYLVESLTASSPAIAP